jgi:cob(I)alamin adenosyltransferase
MSTKIYTKTGDKGATALIGGTKVSKSHERIEAYGTIDELNSFIGLLIDHLTVASTPLPAISTLPPTISTLPPTISTPLPAISTLPPFASTPPPTSTPAVTPPPFTAITPFLREIQDRLFTIGSSLACDPEKETKLKIPDLKEEDVLALENEIDRMETLLPPLKFFVLPGGHIAVSTTHIARCVCRRAERNCVRLQDDKLFVEPLVLRYLNRLSDYLFVLSRFIANQLHVPEIAWISKRSEG